MVSKSAQCGPVQSFKRLLDRLDTETTRVTVFAVYTKSIPVIEETFDMNVVRNLLDGLPLFAAFEAGPTKLSSGVNDALQYARQWESKSATLVVVSDGDSEERAEVRPFPLQLLTRSSSALAIRFVPRWCQAIAPPKTYLLEVLGNETAWDLSPRQQQTLAKRSARSADDDQASHQRWHRPAGCGVGKPRHRLLFPGDDHSHAAFIRKVPPGTSGRGTIGQKG